jgi:RHS repeat-associated protein
MGRQQKALLTRIVMLAALIHGASFASEIPAESYTYDTQGNLLSIKTRLGNTTTNTSDVFGRLNQQELPIPTAGSAPSVIKFGYNSLHTVTSVKDPRNLTTSYLVDGLNQVQQLNSPDTGATSVTFDAGGNRKTVKDSRSVTATYTHDALDRVTAIAYPNWQGTTYSYGTSGTSAGRLTGFSDESGNTSYTYDGFGRVLTKTQVVVSGQTQRSLAVTYAYGTSGPSTGKVLSMTYPSGVRLNVTYDAAGRVAGFAINPTQLGGGTNPAASLPVFSGVTYSATGAPTGWNWGSGLKYERTYDQDGRVSTYTLGTSHRKLDYDDDGRLVRVTSDESNASLAKSFEYDGLGRLIRYDSGTTAYKYFYDATGNRIGATVGSASQSIKIDSVSNRLTSLSGQVAKNYLFDAAGNQTTDGTTVFIYSPRGRPSTVRNGATTYTQLFNAMGERVFKGSSNTVYLYDGAGQLLGEYDIGSGSPISETIYFGNQPVAVVRPPSGRSAPEVTTQLFFVHADHLATPRMITAAAGNSVRWRWDDADPFGMTPPIESFPVVGAFVFNQRMPGQYYDRETNLFYNYFREYDPQTGRYVQSDPIGLKGGINTYAYVGGNPISRVDPDGLDWREKMKDLKDVGLIDSYTASNDADAASSIAKQSGLPGSWNGPQDAYRHCVWSCMMTKDIGAGKAKSVGDNHEDAGDREHHQPKGERDMDTANNAAGRTCGAKDGDKKNCPQKCMDLYLGGGLFGVGGGPMPPPPRRK